MPNSSPSPVSSGQANPAVVNLAEPTLGQLGQYLLLEKLGQGGMGTVYRALHTRLKKTVALKTLAPERMNSPAAASRFAREMEAIGRLEHPNLIRALDAGEHDGQHFLVMEVVDGQNLARLVDRQGPLACADACELVRQASLGMQYICDQGMVHRDIKPSNLVLSRTGQVKILDLGLALLKGEAKPEEELTRAGQVMGTGDFMAPEQGMDSHAVDIRADIYSLGCTLYKLLSGKAPFSSPQYDTLIKKIMAHANEPVPPLHLVRADIPGMVLLILERMLAKDPKERYALPQEVAEALEPFCHGAALEQLANNPDQPKAGDVAEEDKRHSSLDDLSDRSTRSHSLVTPLRPLGSSATLTQGRRRLVGMITAGILLVILVGLVSFWPHLPWAYSPSAEADLSEPPPPKPRILGEKPGDLAPGIWHNLLQQKPQALIWPLNNPHFSHDPKRQEILMPPVSDHGLVALAKVEQPSYKFQVTIRQQNPWTGGVGIFFGYHPKPLQNIPCMFYQTIYLHRMGNDFRQFAIGRGQGNAREEKGRTFISPTLISAEPASIPSLGEGILEIHVSNGRLLHVCWEKAELTRLTSKENNKPYEPADYCGFLGVFSRQDMCVFCDARLYLFERTNP